MPKGEDCPSRGSVLVTARDQTGILAEFGYIIMLTAYAKELLGWFALRGMAHICANGWNWPPKNPQDHAS
ncbi:MAG: hypothetical protein PHD48_11685 [Alphaproteobacteria bacterium]|nr:hypothetical protein [Alphaproteobacteria bacterium]